MSKPINLSQYRQSRTKVQQRIVNPWLLLLSLCVFTVLVAVRVWCAYVF